MNMKRSIATASRIIDAPANTIYEILADYRSQHQRILPKPYFRNLDVEEGGFGEGTIINFTMRILGRNQSFRALISEQEIGRVLLEADIQSGVSTRFDIFPLNGSPQTRVTISTELRNESPLEGRIAKLFLQKIYRRELELLAKFAREEHVLTRSASTGAARS
jgi:hypothetical protein